jgi:glycosyltransferase involved in cell wall biosynthesis
VATTPSSTLNPFLSGTNPDRVRVAFLGVSPDSRGGIAQFGRGLAERVAEDAEILVIGYRQLYPRFTRPGRQAADPSRRRGRLEHRSIPVPWLPWTWRATTAALTEFRPDAVVVQWWSPLFGPCVRWIARRARRRNASVLVMCHNYRPHERFPFWRRISRAALSQAHALAAFSERVAEETTRLVPGVPMHVGALPPLIAADAGPDATAPSGLPDGPLILFFGNVRAYKGLEDLVAALPIVRRSVDAKLVVAGSFFEPFERYEGQVRELGVADAVRFLPDYIPDEQVPGLFAACDVVALPYRSASQSGVLGQAALAARPVVATRVGSLPQAIGERGVLVAPSDPAALAAGLVTALTDPPPPPLPDEDAWRRWRDLVLDVAQSR